jgi:trimeric autotransporter adhesin
MRNRAGIGQVVGMVYVASIVLFVSLAGAAHAGSEGDGGLNVYYGTDAGASLTFAGASNNAFFGYKAGNFNSLGNYNTFIGYEAGVGSAALSSNSGSRNIFIGSQAGYSFTSGSDNNFIGDHAGESNTTGNSNVFIGSYAGAANMIGWANTFVGYYAGKANHDSINNTYIGQAAGWQNTTGHDNTFVGNGAGYSNLGANYNTFIGAEAGHDNTAGLGNVFLGYRAGYYETLSNTLYIANSATTTPLIKGDFSAGTVTIYGTLTTASDERLKKNILPLDAALKQIMSLQGVSYEWKEEFIGGGLKRDRQIGLIAQEVEKVMPELVHTDSNGYKAIAYDKLAPVLIEAVKEQQKTVQQQKQELAQFNALLKDKDDSIKRLEKALEKMERRMAALEFPAQTLALK